MAAFGGPERSGRWWVIMGGGNSPARFKAQPEALQCVLQVYTSPGTNKSYFGDGGPMSKARKGVSLGAVIEYERSRCWLAMTHHRPGVSEIQSDSSVPSMFAHPQKQAEVDSGEWLWSETRKGASLTTFGGSERSRRWRVLGHRIFKTHPNDVKQILAGQSLKP